MLNMSAAVEHMSRQAMQPQQQIFHDVLAMMLETSSGKFSVKNAWNV